MNLDREDWKAMPEPPVILGLRPGQYGTVIAATILAVILGARLNWNAFVILGAQYGFVIAGRAAAAIWRRIRPLSRLR